MTQRENRYVLGKCDYNGSGRKDCEAAITWRFDGNTFSMCAEIWNPRKTDIYCGGQCVDIVAAYFPHDAKARRMVEIWREWHLNDMCAGSPAQREWLRANPIAEEDYRYPKSHYGVACGRLASAGLNPDPGYLHNGKPYAYGSAWLKREIPEDVALEICSWA